MFKAKQAANLVIVSHYGALGWTMPRFLKFISALIALIFICLFYGFFIEPKLLKTRYVTVESSNFSGPTTRIALMSDIHIGGHHVSAARVATIVEHVNALNPDIILIPGDFINGHHARAEHSAAFNAEIDEGLKFLQNLKAPLGVFSSIGNHDVWYDVAFVEHKLKQAGLIVLANKAVTLPNGLCIVGLADHDTQREDKAAFNDCEAGSSIIALMHSPDSFPLLRSDTALAVAGHTHGGQINIPLIGRRVTATSAGQKYAYGLVTANGVMAFVTAGIGTSILPARFRSPPEIVLIELVSN